MFGYRYDTETGLYYLQSRYYNAERGRFINADAIAAVTGELLSANMFAYCKNNVVNEKDPSGFLAMPAGAGDDWEYEEQYEDEYEDVVVQKGKFGNSYRKEREGRQTRGAFGNDRAKNEAERRELHEGKEGGRNDDNKSFKDLKNRNFYKSVTNTHKIGMVSRCGFFVAGTVLVVVTIVEDVATGGVGIVDDPVTLSAGGGMIIRAFAP